MTTFYLIRHATNDLVGKAIAGWSKDVHLNDRGRHQAEELAKRFPPGSIHQVYSSPLERTVETAAPLAKAAGCDLHIEPAIGEIQFGNWTGKRFADLEMDPEWQQWNRCRTSARVPGGESMLEVQTRFVSFMQQLCRTQPGASIALVSHGDPIRAALFFYLGMPLDFVHRVEVSPASVSVIAIGDEGARVMQVNFIADWHAGWSE